MFKLVALSVAALLWGAWAVLKLREVEGEPLRKVLEGFSRLGWFNKVAILFVVAQLTMFGGAKHGGTNDVDDVGGTNAPPLTMGVRFGGSSSRISPEDYDNGYVLYRVETNETFDHYVNFYPICDKVVYPGNETGRKALFIGDSFSLGLQELIASHFDETYYFYADGTVELFKGQDFADTCEEYGIMNIPTMLFFQNGELVNRHVGACRKQDLAQLFDSLL